MSLFNIEEMRFPLTYSQQSIWLHQIFDLKSNVYNVPVRFAVDTKDQHVVENVINQLPIRIDILRSVFGVEKGIPYWRLASKKKPRIAIIDGNDQLSSTQITSFIRKTFDIQKGPLYRFAIVRGKDTLEVLMVFHHLISDGTSLYLLARDIQNIVKQGVTIKLIDEKNKTDYFEPTLSERAYLESKVAEVDKNYWLEKLSGSVPRVRLPYDRAYVSVGRKGASEGIIIEKELRNQLDKVANLHDTSIFNILLCCFLILLHRLSGEVDISIGSPVINRNRHAAASQGLFLNTVIFRMLIDSEMTLADFIKATKSMLIGALKHRRYPFKKLIEDLNIPLEKNEFPVTDVFFNGLTFFDDDLVKDGFNAFQKGYGLDTNFDLNCYVGISAHSILVRFDYREVLFNQSTIRSFLTKFEEIIRLLCQNVEQKLCQLRYTTLSFDKQSFKDSEWYNPQFNIIDIFRSQVQKFPLKPAVIYNNNTITYTALEEVTTIFANVLLKLTTEKRVGICVKHGPNVATAVLSVLKAGKSYVPLTSQSGQLRNEQIISELQLSVIIVDDSSEELFRSASRQIINVNSQYSSKNDLLPPVNITPNLEAYLLYTSGTTGKLKGVVQTHGNILHFISQYTSAIAILPDDRLTGFSPLTYDSFNNDFFGAILNGATYCPLTIAENDTVEVTSWLNQNQITIWHSVPGVFRIHAAHWFKSDSPASLRIIKMTGEAVKTQDFDLFKKVTKHSAVFIVSLGSTESTLSTINTFTHRDLIHQPIMPVGFPIERTDISIWDLSNGELDVLEPGQIVIQSEYAAMSYFNDPLQSNRVFKISKGKMYYLSGDRGKILLDGRLQWLGRMDAQFKLSGVRIEPGEIEYHLLLYANGRQIKQAIVVPKKGDNNLYIYYSSQNPIKTDKLHDFLSKRLPVNYLPLTFIWLKEFPRSLHGKVDINSLPQPEPYKLKSFVKPGNETEKQLVAIWSELLEIDKGNISVYDNFFEIGGHSLKGIQLIHRIQHTFARKLSLLDVFSLTTVRKQAQKISKSPHHTTALIPKIPRRKSYELSASQRRLWILSQFNAVAESYHISQAVEICGVYRKRVFQKIFKTLIRRHESLRTSFVLENGVPRQSILQIEKVKFSIEHICLKGKSSDSLEVDVVIKERLSRAFDLDKAPLLRVAVIQLSNQKHIMLLVVHHIVSDGWSSRLLIEEISKLYHNYTEKDQIPLKALRIQYKDFAQWHNQLRRTKAFVEHQTFWRKKFDAGVPVLDLPLDFPRQQVQTFQGNRINFQIDSDLSRLIKIFTKDTGGTLFNSLAALVKTLLFKYTNQTDIIVGTDEAGRIHMDLEDQIGFYVNAVPLRTVFQRQGTFKDLVDNVKETNLKAFEHTLYTLDYLIEDIKFERDLSRNPFFDVMISLQNVGKKSNALPYFKNLKVKKLQLPHTSSQFDLAFIFEEGETILNVAIEYNNSLFTKDRIERLKEHLLTITRVVMEHPETKLDDLNYLETTEQSRLLTFAGQRVDFSLEKTVYHYIDEWACRVPEKRALRCGSESVSYKELSEGSVALAAYLQGCGVVPGEAVAILMERGVDMVLCILALWRLGCSYVPISISEPPARIKQILADADVLHVLVNAELTNDYDAKLIDIQEQSSTFASLSPPCFNINELSYIIFTSGSTGRPKGAMIEHLGMMNHLFAKVNDLSMSTETIVAQTASHTFDISVWQFFSALLVGGQTVIYVDDEVKDIDGILKKLETDHVQVLEVVPSYLSILQRLCAEERICFAALTHLLVTGESFPLELAKKWQALYPDIVLVNAYGPTEASDDITHAVLTREVLNTGVVPIGKPIQNTNIYIVDHQGRLCPIGIKGEIWVSGMGVGRGYINDQERTQTSFMRDPFTPNHNIRLYKTGDIGCWLPDGTILFYGRKDEQVKIRGFRIEIGEIENAINQIIGIQESAVVIKGDRPEDRQICAFYTTIDNLDEGGVRAVLKQKVPHYMVPSHITRLSHLPKTNNGKIDRRSLIDAVLIVDQNYKPPTNEVEKKLVNIYSRLLNFDYHKIGLSDSFFELGANSLTLIKLSNEISKQFDVKIPYKFLYKNPDILSIGNFLLNADKEEGLQLCRANRKSFYKVTPAQKGIFDFQQLNKDSVAYNVYKIATTSSQLDLLKLEQAINVLIQRHESLRTVFLQQEDGVYQQIIEPYDFKLKTISLPDSTSFDLIEALIRPFDLSKEPLIDVVIVIENNSWKLLIQTHHIVCDGISVSILINELNLLYNGNQLKDLLYQFKDYSEWYYSKSNEKRIKAQEDFWLKLYNDEIQKLDLPFCSERSAQPSYEGKRERFVLNSNVFSKLKIISKTKNITPFSFLLSIYYLFLYKITGQKQIIVGVPVSGRNNASVEGIVGMFVNMLPVKVSIDPSQSFSEFFIQFNEIFTECLNNQDYPISALQKRLSEIKQATIMSLIEVTFVYNNYQHESLSLNHQMKDSSDDQIYRTSKYDLTLFCEERSDELELSFIGNSSIFSNELATLSTCFKNILQQIMEGDLTHLDKVDIIPIADRSKIIEKFNNIKQVHIPSTSIYRRVYQSMKAHPQSTAVISNGQSLTYKELLANVDRCANYLINKGCNENDLIATVLKPSLELVVGILAINKIGACVLALDADIPNKRIEVILTDAEPVHVFHDENFNGQILNSFGHSQITVTDDLLVKENTCHSYIIPVNTYVVYTSGTTGKPNGVPITNEGLINYLEWFRKTTNVDRKDATILLSSFSYDLGYTSFYSALYNGQTIHLLDKEKYLNTEFLIQYIIDHQITYIKLTPSHFGHFLPFKEMYKKSFLKWVILGGEKIRISEVETMYRCKPNIRYMNHYGPTETTIGIIYEIIETENFEQYLNKTIIGRPIFNTQAFILDSNNGLLPVGFKGELCISGCGLSPGYLNAPTLTNERFISTALFGNKRLYKTGDYARWLANGKIEFLGRRDGQIKLNGYRIELAEIENVLAMYDEVVTSVVLKMPLGHREVLAAYVVASSILDISKLLTGLKAVLPFFMIPNYICQIPALPLTPNGKIDCSGLPSPTRILSPDEVWTDLEIQLKEIWSNIFNKKDKNQLSLTENFFEAGANSIIAVQFINEIYKAFGIVIKFRDLYLHTNIKDLAILINNSVQSTDRLQKSKNKSLYVASAPQRQMFIENQLAPESLTYNKVYVIRFLKKMTAEKITETFKYLINVHVVFRMTFELFKDNLFMKIHESCPLEITTEVISAEKLKEKIKSFSNPFNLQQLPLIKIKLFEVDGFYTALIDTHHITTDGVSMLILLQEFMQLIDGGSKLSITHDYIDYTEWLANSYLTSQQGKDKKYWDAVINTRVSATKLPFAVTTNESSPKCRTVTLDLDGDCYRKINDLVGTEKITHYAFFLTCFSLLLNLNTKTGQVFLGIIMDGRNMPDSEKMIGMFVNMLPFSLQLNEHETVLSVLRRVNLQVMDFYSAQTYPLQDINSSYKKRYKDSLLDKMNILFEFNSYTSLLDKFSNMINIDSVHLEGAVRDFVFRISSLTERFTIQIEFSESTYKDTNIRLFLSEYSQLIQQVLTDSNIQIQALTTREQQPQRSIDINFDFDH